LAVRLRLRRIGKKKMPAYQIVAADSRKARDGRFLEVVGRYEPQHTPMVIETKDRRVLHWLKNGAHPTETVRSLFQRTGLWYRWTLTRNGLDEARVATEMEKWEMAQPLKRQRGEARRAKRAEVRRKAKKGPEAEPTPAQAGGGQPEAEQT
jgi:small subunit ribosomal protein S16